MEFGISKQNLIDLFTNRRTDIIPSEEMTFDEKIDAASRFVGYVAALTFGEIQIHNPVYYLLLYLFS